MIKWAIRSIGIWILAAGMLLASAVSQTTTTKGFWLALGYYKNFSSMELTEGGGYVIAGGNSLLGGDGLITKLTSSGKHIWTKRFPDLLIRHVKPTRDGGYAVAGEFENSTTYDVDAFMLLLSSTGAVLWANTYGTKSKEDFTCLDQTTDGGFVLVGHSYVNNEQSYDVWVVRLNAKGEILWQNRLGGKRGDYAYSVQQTSDGGYVIAAYTTSFGTGGAEGWCIKLGASGKIVWQKTYGGSLIDIFDNVRQTPDGGYIVIGSTESYGGDSGAKRDLWCLKLDASGNITWQYAYGSAEDDFGRSIRPLKDGGYIAAGRWGQRCWGLKLSALGGVKWSRVYGTKDDFMQFFDVRPNQGGGYSFAGLLMGELKVANLKIYDGVLALRSGSDGFIKDTCADLTETTNPSANPSQAKPKKYAVRMISTSARTTALSFKPESAGFIMLDVCASGE